MPVRSRALRDHRSAAVSRLLPLHALPAAHGHGSSANGRVPQAGFQLLQGEQALRTYAPAGGKPKLFCATCGSALFSGDPFSDEQVAVRLGTLDRDPGIRPQYRQFLDSAAPWEPLPEDGLERHAGSRGW